MGKAKPRFAGLIPGGKTVDGLRAKKKFKRARQALRAAERSLVLSRRMRGNRAISMSGTSQSRTDQKRINVINSRLNAVSKVLRGRVRR